MYSWSYSNIVGGGEKWSLNHSRFDTPLATVVRLPGTVCRIYYRGGAMADCKTLGEVFRELKSRLGMSVPRIANVSDDLLDR